MPNIINLNIDGEPTIISLSDISVLNDSYDNQGASVDTRGTRIPIYRIILVTAASVSSVLILSFYLLYSLTIHETGDRLHDFAVNEARIIEIIARNHMADDRLSEAEAFTHVLSVMNTLKKNFKGFGETGEFTIARREGEMMVFYVNNRNENDQLPDPVRIDSDNARPMHAVTVKGESGVMINRDYRGMMVLAGFEPVHFAGLGVVAKMDLAEIRKPYFYAAIISIFISVAFMIAASVYIRFTGIRIIHGLTDLNTRLDKTILEKSAAEEKLRQVNAELEASNEELTSTNEEMASTLEEFDRSQSEILNNYRKLHDSEERFRELFKSTPSCVVIYRPTEGKDDFDIVDMNKMAEITEQVNRIDVIGKSVQDVFPGVRAMGLFDVFLNVQKTGNPETHPLTFYKDGRISGWKENNVYRLNTGEIVAVYRDLTEQKRYQNQLEISEVRYRNLFEYSNDAIFIHDQSGTIVDVNKRGCELLKSDRAFIIGRNLTDFSPDGVMITDRLAQISVNGFVRFEMNLTNTAGEIVITENSARFAGETSGVIQSTIRDITAIKKNEEALYSALNEKEILIRELFHRTKNNLQIVSSMLKLEASHANDQSITNLALDIDSQIHAMSLVHQKLYQSKNLSRINAREYLSDLVSLIIASYKPCRDITFTQDIDDRLILIDYAAPLGMITAELVANSCKHAFADSGECRLSIHYGMTDEATVRYVYTDNGRGLPADWESRSKNSLGMKTLQAIAQHQLQGSITFSDPPGFRVEVVYNEKLYKERV
jgi:PAS domain S-box-containing protein